MMNWIARLFRKTVLVLPMKTELVVVQLDGCMAHVHTEIRRGRIVGISSVLAYGSSRPIELYVVRRDDGTEFTAIKDRCQKSSRPEYHAMIVEFI